MIPGPRETRNSGWPLEKPSLAKFRGSVERETLGQTQNSGRHRSVDMFFKFLWQKVMEFRGIKHDPSDPMDPTPGFLFRSAIPPAVVVKSKVSKTQHMS